MVREGVEDGFGDGLGGMGLIVRVDWIRYMDGNRVIWVRG